MGAVQILLPAVRLRVWGTVEDHGPQQSREFPGSAVLHLRRRQTVPHQSKRRPVRRPLVSHRRGVRGRRHEAVSQRGTDRRTRIYRQLFRPGQRRAEQLWPTELVEQRVLQGAAGRDPRLEGGAHRRRNPGLDGQKTNRFGVRPRRTLEFRQRRRARLLPERLPRIPDGRYPARGSRTSRPRRTGAASRDIRARHRRFGNAAPLRGRPAGRRRRDDPPESHRRCRCLPDGFLSLCAAVQPVRDPGGDGSVAGGRVDSRGETSGASPCIETRGQHFRVPSGLGQRPSDRRLGPGRPHLRPAGFPRRGRHHLERRRRAVPVHQPQARPLSAPLLHTGGLRVLHRRKRQERISRRVHTTPSFPVVLSRRDPPSRTRKVP